MSSMRTVLITGFGPFPGAPFNPSGPLVRRLVRIRRPALANVKLIGHVFPTSYRAVDRDLPALIARHHPDAILMFGLAARSRHVRIETQARNTLAILPDASGFAPAATAIQRTRRRQLPIRAPRIALLRAARAGKIPARLSCDAGRYLCNYLYWHGLEAAAQVQGPKVVAFIHIPDTRRKSVPARRKRASFTLADLVRMGEPLLVALAAALNCRPRQ